jgi:2-dehydro-3-deoxyphosphooctonate aldolase (KDO 8-P synthase)
MSERNWQMKVQIGSVTVGDRGPLVLIAGPCVVEDRDLMMRTAEMIRKTAARTRTPVIFKSSFRKANRTSAHSFQGIGNQEALRILADVKKEFGLPILTDIHKESEAIEAAEVADVLQIPAFLCRQTELLQAAGKTGRAINIKKGQFMAPEDMTLAAEKVVQTGNTRVLLTERGTTFGYHNLVVDMRSLQIMAESGFPVVLDATHSVQLPAGEKSHSGGQPQFIFPLARAGAAVGIDALFVEVHPDPPRALSDTGSQLPLDLLGSLLEQVVGIDTLVKRY